MNRLTPFSYQCNQCGLCCHNQVITLSPYDVIRLARAAGTSISGAIAKYTIRRGSILKFDKSGHCAALDGTTCTLHSGRPLACRLYPLGMEHHRRGIERYMALEPTEGSRGIYGDERTVADFLAAQGAEVYLQMNRCYATLLGTFRQRIEELTDFDIIEPREFWRVAVREALAETNFDFNPIIETLFHPANLERNIESDCDFVEHHLKEIKQRIHAERDPAILAAAAVMLAVSLGYSPGAVMIGCVSPARSSD